MSSAKRWATTIWCSGRILHSDRSADPGDEPALLIQRVARNPILCGRPVEYFSQEMPVWHPRTPDEDRLLPIDVLYGRYDPKNRSIETFVNRIRQDASTFGADADELREIVRIHEYAHAVVHLGSHADYVHDHLAAFGPAKKTEWSEFINQRTCFFAGLPVEVHEFLAQALTHATLQKLSVSHKSERLSQVFEALELKQAPHYRLSPSVKQCAAQADWPLILEAARGQLDAYREQDFTLRSGLEALVCSAVK